MNRKPHYEQDDETFSADAYTVDGYRGIAWHVLGWETEPDEDTEWSGMENRTGNIIAVMIGDDRKFSFEPDDVTPLERKEYCGVCGQIGCAHDGLERDEDGDDDAGLLEEQESNYNRMIGESLRRA